MTGSYWHLLDEDEWAELKRSEQLPLIDCDPIVLEHAKRYCGRNGSALENEADAFASAKAAAIDADLASLISCLGIPLQAVYQGGSRRRVALDRLSNILRETGSSSFRRTSAVPRPTLGTSTGEAGRRQRRERTTPG
jgi:hypothetical protein